ncbi:DUF262 domain-containing protein [Clostridium saccharobutylicum]|uniref:DUF262 domain-containing protein n=1 Tax=Clostridium saccharobutylicum DSM 13864 TaxID=1345695 RepID=U5N0J8_CLOSA|nr:DUF262 domain-containing protein [Clostridium saccharobutylicum]AGX45431.1 hypothetical protein CLSA_c45040 [Clostridium saccharobutylicum DSM 13864]AQR92703.1 hypothetical protein CLOSC_44660 [Clostridium saccharobutylicum]AQS02605.1 hypothetical protein CSACC_44710 [Clostridium saccharobutylicum]AQS12211.1 hypothetical protein CLOBY_44040 [Clostridium saccharobutylicum]AQS16588.1 hypothetical protein CLOSACC_44710 [Clostridium saccharobutylicum]
MTEQLMSLSKIFTEQIFRIPDYQRGYSWTIKEVQDFWNDLLRLQENKNHYVGVLTLEPVDSAKYKTWIDDTWLIDSKRFVPYFVVDGQQRLTTSILLIHSIIEIMEQRNINKLNYTSQEEISRRFIFDSKDENKSRTYIFGYENENPSYEYLINKIFKQKTQTSSHIEETIYTSNLRDAKDFFMNKLNLISNTKDLESIYTKITQHFLFNLYVISSDIDVFVTFETMNNRGKPLSHLELLKNRLIYLSTLFKTNDNDKKRLRRNINECWKDIYHLLGKNKDNKLLDDDFLNAHFKFYFCNELKKIMDKHSNYRYLRSANEIQQNYLLEEYFIPLNVINDKLKIEEIFNYIESMKSSITIWEYINNPLSSNFSDDVKEYINKINYIITYCSRYYRSGVTVFLLACLDMNESDKDILNLLKLLERYLFLMLFYPSEVLEGNHTFEIDFEQIVLKLNKSETNLTKIIDRIEKTSNQIITATDNKKLIMYYSRCGFYHTNWLRYFLCEYETSLMKQSKNKVSKLDRDLYFIQPYDSIEHIYPQNSHNQYWLRMFKNFSTKERSSLKCSLGNFVGISKPKNGKLGNKSFPDKKYNLENSLGYKYGSYAEIELTNYEDWSANEILSRGIKLVNFLITRWNIKIGSSKKSEKKDFLGLSFLK